MDDKPKVMSRSEVLWTLYYQFLDDVRSLEASASALQPEREARFQRMVGSARNNVREILAAVLGEDT